MAAPLHARPAGRAPVGAREVVGTLWLDGPVRHAQDAARLVELAVARARDRGEAARADRRLEALDEAIRAMAGVLAVDRVLQLIVDRVRDLAGAHYAALGIVDAGRRDRALHHQRHQSRRARPDRRAAARPRAPRPHHPGGPLVPVADIAADPRRVGFPPNHPAMHSFLGVPVVVEGRVDRQPLPDRQGRAAVHRGRPASWSRCSRATPAIAIENARLHEQVQRLAIVEERERIGQDLHDGIIQAIYAVGLRSRTCPT